MTLIRHYLPIVKATFSVSLAYRMNVLLWLFSNALEIGIMLILWAAVYRFGNVDSLYGFSFQDILFYNLFMTMSSNLVNMNTLGDVDDDYVDGKIAMHLIKPISYTKMMFAKNLGSNLFRNLMITLPLVLIFSVALMFNLIEFSLNFSQMMLYLISIILGLWSSFYFNFSFSALVFKTEAIFGLWQLNLIILQILSGFLIPLAFFPVWAQAIITKLPFASIQSTPTLILLGRLSGFAMWEALGLQVVWVMILTLISHWVWTKTMVNLKVHGG